MRITITVEIEVTRITGKFASKDDIAEKIVDAIDAANEGTFYSDEDAEYEVTDWVASNAS